VGDFLKQPPAAAFDLIFADPPYDKRPGLLDNDPLLPQLVPLAAENGFFVWEHYAKQRLQIAGSWEIIRSREYGETGLTFLRLLHKNNKDTL
jgi:16S rRNA (guanine966-N2)-methyltransferase